MKMKKRELLKASLDVVPENYLRFEQLAREQRGFRTNETQL
jgi:hypothetical protein